MIPSSELMFFALLCQESKYLDLGLNCHFNGSTLILCRCLQIRVLGCSEKSVSTYSGMDMNTS